MTPARRRLRRLLAWVAASFVIALLVPIALVVAGVTVDASPWREQVAQAIGSALHREVRLDGSASITFSLRPGLQVGGIHVLNAPGFSEPDLASFGEARFKLDLLPLLRNELRLRELSARDVRIRLEVLADGHVNWQFRAPGESSPGASTGPAASTRFTMPAPTRDTITEASFDHVVFERVALEFVRSDGTTHHFSLDRLDASAAEGQPLQIRMHGKVERSFPYQVDIEGGSASTLLAAREPWPLRLRLAFAGTELTLDGSLFRPLLGGQVDLSLALRIDELSQLEQLLQLTLPPVGAARLSAQLHWQPGLMRLAQIEGRMGESALRGALELSTVGAVPRLSGEIDLPVLDLQAFRGPAPADGKVPRNLLDVYRDLQSHGFDLERLASIDADVELRVGQWLGMPGDVRDAALALHLEHGVLRSPVQVSAAGVALRGGLDIDAAAATPTFSLALSATDSKLGRLAGWLTGSEGIAGDVGRIDLGLAAQGRTLGAMTRSLMGTLALEGARLSYGHRGGARPVELRLQRFDLALPAGAPLKGRAHGTLLGEPFNATFRGGDLPALASGVRWPVALRARASGVTLDLAGHLLAAPESAGADLRVTFDAQHARSAARWLGLAVEAQVPVHLGGQLSARRDAVWLRDFTLTLGRTRVSGEIGRTALGTARPLLQARLDVAEIDVAQLQAQRPPPRRDAVARAVAGARPMLELPILPQGIDLGDADVQVKLHRLALPTTDITDLRFEGRVREGRMSGAPFSATVAGTPFRGSAALDLRGAVPEVALQLQAAKVDVGELLRRLRLADDIDARVDALQIALALRGSRLEEMLEASALTAELRGGELTLRDPANQPLVAMAIGRAKVEVPAGAPLHLDLEGSIDDTPATIRLASGRLADLAQRGRRVPFTLAAEAAGTRLDLDGSTLVPLRQRDADLVLRMAGRRLDTLNRLARTELPPWGPWSLGGKLVVSERGYEMPTLQVQVGSSRLVGQGSLSLAGERPLAMLKLKAPTVQVDDFRFGDGSPLAKAKPQEEARGTLPMREQASGSAQQAQRLLSRATLMKLDAVVDIDVAQVLSGTDRLGDGQLHARLQAGRLGLSPAEVRMPGGAARLEMSYEPLPGGEEVRLHSRLRVDRFDYAVLAHRIQPDSDLQGEFSVHFDLDATAPLEDLMKRGNGKLDFAIWPVKLNAGVFDNWAVGLLLALLPVLDPASTSELNCAVAGLDLRDGVLRENTLWLDTTRLRIAGKARVDFHDESLAVRLQARPKKPQLFSVVTPVEVSGHLTDFEIGRAKGSTMDTIGRFLASIVTTPLQMLTSRPPPADGSDVCPGAMAVTE